MWTFAVGRGSTLPAEELFDRGGLGHDRTGGVRKISHALDEWRKSEATGKCPTVDAIQKACQDHVEKQRRALLGLTFAPENTSAFGTAIRTKIEHRPQDTEYQQAEKIIQTALKSLAKRAPDDRHVARMQALYVDLQDSGLDWSRPSELSQDNAKKLPYRCS